MLPSPRLGGITRQLVVATPLRVYTLGAFRSSAPRLRLHRESTAMTSFLLRAFKSRHLPVVACVFAAIAPSLSGQQAPVCAASPEVQAALNQIPSGNQPAGQSLYQFVLARRTALQNLMRQYPGDVFVESAYIGAMQYYDQYYGRPIYSDSIKVIAEYRARHEQHPEDAEITYLYATALVGRDTPQAIKLFDKVLERDPN